MSNIWDKVWDRHEAPLLQKIYNKSFLKIKKYVNIRIMWSVSKQTVEKIIIVPESKNYILKEIE